MARVFAAGVVALAVGCVPYGASLGERAASQFGDGGGVVDVCPSWATCAASGGLAFAGVSPSPHPVYALALGGRERIRVLDVGLYPPTVGDPGTHRAFTASSTGPSTFRVEGVSPPELTVVAVAPGVAHLRIDEPRTGLLIDTIAIGVERVVETRLSTYASRIVFPDRGIDEVAVGAVDSLDVALYGASGAQLADDTLVLHGGDLSAPAHGAIEVIAERDAERVSRILPVVIAATELVVSLYGYVASLDAAFGAPTTLETDTLALGGSDLALMCAVPLDGTLVVAGAPLLVTSDDETVLTVVDEEKGCLLLQVASGDLDAGVALAAGDYATDLHLTALGVTRTIHVTVSLRYPGSALVSGPPSPRTVASLGERAAAPR
jgi:hypothetical protein